MEDGVSPRGRFEHRGETNKAAAMLHAGAGEEDM